MITFGPIPSRRLGKSLGINNIPSQKICSYSCVYCQVGITKKYSTTRASYYKPSVIFDEVKKHLCHIKENDIPDYLTFVSNGEPTLDISIGESIDKLKSIGIPIAVITNASLLSIPEVRDDLNKADWVSVKVDSGNENVWKEINRPHADLNFNEYKNGLRLFAKEFKGKLNTETMLVKGINDHIEQLQETAQLIKEIKPAVSYISIPTRPPALKWVNKPNEKSINEAYHIFADNQLNPELILDFEGTNTGFTGNAIEDIINICSVHPIREDTMKELLRKNQADPTILDTLVTNKYIQKVEYKSNIFYIRKFLI
jgi:wyosine [tRNA(Phe)-imidazoG37] synthetase (radical SAM superfamily)